MYAQASRRHTRVAPRKSQLPHALELAVEYQDPADLVPNLSNPRRHSARQVQQLARSISAFGFLTPLLIDDGGKVITGHGRLLAAQQLGLHRVPTISIVHLTDAQARAFAIADNRLNEISDWDEALLAEQFAFLSSAALDFSLEATGFELPEIDLLIQGSAQLNDKADPDDRPVNPGPSVAASGDMWELGRHRIACGSALDPVVYAQLMGTDRAQVVFSDPPYNVQINGHVGGLGRIRHREFLQASGEMTPEAFTAFLRSTFDLLARHSENGSLHYVCMDWRHVGELVDAASGIYSETKNCCIWDKGSAGMGSFYRSQHEMVWVFKAGRDAHTNNVQLGRFGRSRSNVWSYPGANSFARATDEGDLLALHPTVKPVALVADALMDASDRGDCVLDPFLGSGTTVIAAERTGRVARGIELDARYIDVAIRRWQRQTGKSAVHTTLNCTFDELEGQGGRRD